MKPHRTLPPVASPLEFGDLIRGFLGFFNGRRYVEELEQSVREYFGVKHVFLVSSGKECLFLILQALKSISPGKEKVLIPAYTCFSVPSAIVKAGLRVSLCDIDLASLDFDDTCFEGAVDDDTLCVVPNHLFAIPANMDRIGNICATHGIFVVEDAAQAMGGRYQGRLLGTIGDVGFFSLGRGKNITCGGGGVVVTNSDTIARAIAARYAALEEPRVSETAKELLQTLVLRLFIYPSLYWLPSGLPFLGLGETSFYEEFPVTKLSGVKAGIMKRWEQRLSQANAARLENAQFFLKRLRPEQETGRSIPYLRLPLMLNQRDQRNSREICRAGIPPGKAILGMHAHTSDPSSR
jgi:hypothetical protein